MKPQSNDQFSETLESLKFIKELYKRFNVTILRENPEDPKIRLTPSTGVSVADIRNSLFDELLKKNRRRIGEKGFALARTLPYRL